MIFSLMNLPNWSRRALGLTRLHLPHALAVELHGYNRIDVVIILAPETVGPVGVFAHSCFLCSQETQLWVPCHQKMLSWVNTRHHTIDSVILHMTLYTFSFKLIECTLLRASYICVTPGYSCSLFFSGKAWLSNNATEENWRRTQCTVFTSYQEVLPLAIIWATLS